MLLSVSFSTTFAYWQGNINGANTNGNGNIFIGKWNTTGEENNHDLNNPILKNPPSNVIVLDGLSSFPHNYSIKKGDVVFYKGRLYIATGSPWDFPPKTPEEGSFWDSYSEGLIYYNGSNIYTTGDMTYYNSNFFYARGNDSKIYKPNEDGISKPNAWQVNEANAITYYPKYLYYTNGDYVTYQGDLYLSITSSNYGEKPITDTSFWTKIVNPNYVGNATYSLNQVISYKNNYYRVLNPSLASTTTPGTSKGVFNKISNDYVANNTYYAGDYVVYNNEIFKVEDPTKANLYSPKSANSYGAWTNVSNYDYDPYSTYSVDRLVIVNGLLYKSKVENTNKPVTNTDYWTLV